MAKHLDILLKDTLFYGLSSAVNKGVWIILVPVLARVFSPAEYAVMDVNIIFYTAVSTFLFLGLDSSLVRFYYKFETQEEKRLAVSTILAFETVVLAASCAVMLIFSSDLSFLIFKTREHSRIMKTVVLIVPFFIMYSLFLNILRCRFEKLKFLFLSVGATLAQVFLTLYLVLYCKTGVLGIFDAILYTQAAFAAMGFWMTRKCYSFSFSFPLLRDMLGFGVPSLGRSFSQTTVFFADRFFLVALMPLNVVGLYSMGARVASVINMAVMGFVLAWSPFALSIHRQPGAKQTYSKVLTYYLAACSTIVVVLSLFSNDILRVIAPAYIGSGEVVGVLAYSYMLAGAYSIVCIGVTITGQSVHLAWPSILGAAINIVAYLILIPALGILGAAWSSFAANLTALVFLFWINQKVYPVEYEVGKILQLGVICLAAIFAGARVTGEFQAGNAAVLKALVFSGYLVLLAAANIVGMKEMSRVAGIFKTAGANTAPGK